MKKNKFSRRHWLVILFGFLMFYFYTATIPDGMNVILPQISSVNNLNYDVLLSFASIAGIISTVVVLVLGKLCVILGSRKMIFIGVLASSVFFYLYGHASSVPMFVVALTGLISCANSFAFIGGGALVANWFPTKKGIASGYTSIGAPFSSMTSVTLYTVTFANFGFKPTMTFISIVLAVFAFICLIFLKDTPEECGEYPDNIPPEERSADELKLVDNEGPATGALKLIRTRQVWFIALMVGFYSMTMMGVIGQFVVRHNEIPLPESLTLVMFTVMGVLGLIGGPIWGKLDAKLGTRKGFIVCCLSMILGMLLDFTNILPLMFVALFFFGLGATGTHVFLTAWIVTVFGRRDSSSAYSVIYPIHCMVNYLAYAVIALARIFLGEMRYSYLIYIASLIVSIILSLITKSRMTQD